MPKHRVKTNGAEVRRRVPVTRSSGNVFRDLGLPRADEMLAKAALANRIAAILEKRGLSQTEAAQLLGVDQPKVSALVRGQLRGFSTERLFRFLHALGNEIEISIVPRPASRGAAPGAPWIRVRTGRARPA